MNVLQHLKRQFPIGQMRSCNTSSSYVTRRNLSVLSLIEWKRLDDNDSHPSVSFEPLIEYEVPNPIAKPISAYKYICSSTM